MGPEASWLISMGEGRPWAWLALGPGSSAEYVCGLGWLGLKGYRPSAFPELPWAGHGCQGLGKQEKPSTNLRDSQTLNR